MVGARFLVVVGLALLVAGCTDDPAPKPEAQSGPDFVLHTRPDDLNATTDPDKFHLHDYWHGQTSLPILKETQLATLTTMGQGVNRLQFRPETGNVIPLGTGNVTVIVSWVEEPENVHGPVHLYVKTQMDNESSDFGVVENGVAVSVPSTNDQNDLPHQILSAWSFDFYLTPDPATGFLHFGADVTMEVTAERGLDIPLFPPHPDHWKNATEILLFDDTTSVGHIDHAPAPNSICTGGCIPVHVPRDGAIVPMGTDHVRVVLTVMEGATGAADLGYHGADTRGFTILEPTSEEGATRIYDIPATDANLDGPYSKSSLWEFQLVTVRTADNGLFYGDYTINATAVRASA